MIENCFSKSFKTLKFECFPVLHTGRDFIIGLLFEMLTTKKNMKRRTRRRIIFKIQVLEFDRLLC